MSKEVAGTTVVMLGNAAIARGAYEAGVKVSAAYPGTPSTEISENLVKYKDELYSEWSPNEKVATEVAIGASISGVRALVSMKHVGVNVASDPLYTISYSGVNGGLVLVAADDPGTLGIGGCATTGGFLLAAWPLGLGEEAAALWAAHRPGRPKK